MAACCCADVPFESTCSSARCFCSQEDRQAERYTVQSVAGVLPNESPKSAEMDWLDTQSVCRKLPSVLVAVPEDDLRWPLSLFFLLLSLVLFFSLHVADTCAGETKTQRKSIRPISWQKPFHIFDCAFSFVLSLGVVLGSRDTMGGTAIKGLLLGLLSPYVRINSGKTLRLSINFY